MEDGTAWIFTFEMDAKSVITSPSGGQVINGPGFHEISGLAWSGRGKITSVEISTDGGETWTAATLQDPVYSQAFTRFPIALAVGTATSASCCPGAATKPGTSNHREKNSSRNEAASLRITATASRAGKSRRTGACQMLKHSLAILCALVAQPLGAQSYGLGREATAAEVESLDITIGPEGRELPAGSGSVAEGSPGL